MVRFLAGARGRAVSWSSHYWWHEPGDRWQDQVRAFGPQACQLQGLAFQVWVRRSFLTNSWIFRPKNVFQGCFFCHVFCDIVQLGSEEGEHGWQWHGVWVRCGEAWWCIFFAWHSFAASSLGICHFDDADMVMFYCENQNHFLDFFGGRLSFSDAGFTCSKRCETTWTRRRMASWRMPTRSGRRVLSVLRSWLAVKAFSCEMSQWP